MIRFQLVKIAMFLGFCLIFESSSQNFNEKIDFIPPMSLKTPHKRSNVRESRLKKTERIIPGPIFYRMGGSVLTGETKVHIIYYGSWYTHQTYIINEFINNIKYTSWFNIEKKYYYQASSASPKVYTTGPVVLGSNVTYYDPAISILTPYEKYKIFTSLISSGKLPNDPKAVYLLLSSADVKVQNFCTRFCGYHSTFTYSGIKYQFLFAGNALNQCPRGCIKIIGGLSIFPNGDPGVDGLINMIARVLVGSMSNPLFNAWSDANGYSNSAKCNWEFGPISFLKNGAFYNMQVNGSYYLVQQNWNPETQSCVMVA